MQDVNHAISVLGERAKLPSLAFNADGAIELIIDDLLSVYLTRVSERAMELSARLADLDGKITADVMQRMLVANCLGDGTGAARLSVEAQGGGAILCERVDVTVLDADALEAVFTLFVRTAAFWMSDSVAELLNPGDASPENPEDKVAGWEETFVQV